MERKDYDIITKSLRKNLYHREKRRKNISASPSPLLPEVDEIGNVYAGLEQLSADEAAELNAKEIIIDVAQIDESPIPSKAECKDNPDAAENNILQSDQNEHSDNDIEESQGKKKKKRKVDLFETVIDEDIATMKSLADQINADGYYDEILPMDKGEIFKKIKRKKQPPYIILAIVGLFIMALYFITSSIGGFLQ